MESTNLSSPIKLSDAERQFIQRRLRRHYQAEDAIEQESWLERLRTMILDKLEGKPSLRRAATLTGPNSSRWLPVRERRDVALGQRRGTLALGHYSQNWSSA